MKKAMGLLAVSVIAVCCSFVTHAVMAGESVKREITTEARYEAGSIGARETRRWLADHATYANGSTVGDFAKIGSVQVVYTVSATGSSYYQVLGGPGGGPPVSLPGGGSADDTISVSSCSHGVSQTWSYTWEGNSSGGGWVLKSYTYNLKSCGSGG